MHRTASFWELLSELTGREIKSRYKQSVLGYAWVILTPLFQMLVMSFVFSTVLKVPLAGLPYSVFLYAGLLPWILFSNAVTSSTNALVGNASLITKIYLPREVFILSTILAKIVDFFLASVVFIGFLLFYHVPVNWFALWFIPIFFIQQIFTFGLSLFLAAANLFYRDIQYVVGLVLMMWMYLTPVMYPADILPEKYRFIFQLNPLAVFINAYRKTILGGAAPNYSSLLIGLLLSVAMCVVGYAFFKKLEGIFADVI